MKRRITSQNSNSRAISRPESVRPAFSRDVLCPWLETVFVTIDAWKNNCCLSSQRSSKDQKKMRERNKMKNDECSMSHDLYRCDGESVSAVHDNANSADFTGEKERNDKKLKVATPTVIIYGNNRIVSAAMVTFAPRTGEMFRYFTEAKCISLSFSLRHGATASTTDHACSRKDMKHETCSDVLIHFTAIFYIGHFMKKKIRRCSVSQFLRFDLLQLCLRF